MLDLAINHESELRRAFLNTVMDLRYQYYNGAHYWELYEAEKNNIGVQEYASIDADGYVIGYLAYYIQRSANNVTGLAICNFEGTPNMTFGRDIMTMIDSIFTKYNFHKIDFTGYPDNPITKHYERLCKKCGGNVIGICHDYSKLLDGKYHDIEYFEIMRKDYLNYRGKMQNFYCMEDSE